MRYKITRLAALVGGILVLAGCADRGETPSTVRTPTESPAARQSFNDADVTFAQQMIPHHEQAIDMALVAQERAENAQVRELAAAIEEAQGPEIATMTGWLEAWGEDVPAETGGMDHGGMSTDDMPGMMSDQEMDSLAAMSGAAFDEMFLTMMIAHHEGAIEMARTEQADGENPEAIALAEKIEADQAAEIDTMRGLLGS